MNFPYEGAEESPDCFYTVETGDNIAGISLKTGVPINLLKKYNHLFGKNDVYSGQVLHVNSLINFH